jgi:hypothetical protein
MSALGQKQTLQHVRAMVRFTPESGYRNRAHVLPSAHQLGQLGDIRCNPPRLVFVEQLCRRLPPWLIL